MKKEEILEMSKKENNNKDFYEIEVEKEGCKLAAILMVGLATIYYCYEIFTGKGENYSFYSLIALYCTVLYGYKVLKIEKNKKLHMFCAIIWGFLTVMAIVGYFK